MRPGYRVILFVVLALAGLLAIIILPGRVGASGDGAESTIPAVEASSVVEEAGAPEVHVAMIGSIMEQPIPVDAQEQPDDGKQGNASTKSRSGLGWLIAVLALAGIAGIVGFGALRLRARRS